MPCSVARAELRSLRQTLLGREISSAAMAERIFCPAPLGPNLVTLGGLGAWPTASPQAPRLQESGLARRDGIRPEKLGRFPSQETGPSVGFNCFPTLGAYGRWRRYPFALQFFGALSVRESGVVIGALVL